MFSEVIKEAMSKAGSLRVKSALNPILWACGIISPMSWISAYMFSNPYIQLILIMTGVAPVALLIFSGLLFSIKDPGRLQSEEYQIKHQTLNLIERKGGKIVLDSDALVEIANPAMPLIESKGH